MNKLFGVLIAMSLLTPAVGSGAEHRTAKPAPIPDFTGLWTNSSLTELERPDDFKTLVISDADAAAYEKKHLDQPPDVPMDTIGNATTEWWETHIGLIRIRGHALTSEIISTGDGQLPLNAAARAAAKAAHIRGRTVFDNPEDRELSERCLEPSAVGPPMLNGGYNDNYSFVQTKDSLVINAEWDHDIRIVRMGKGQKHLPAGVRVWFGDSIGHWEGQTLVIETTNFTAAEVNDPGHDPKADMRVVERLTRLSPSELDYSFMIDDPAMFDAPVQGELVFHTTKGPIYEFACAEGNYGLANILSGARQVELTRQAQAKP